MYSLAIVEDNIEFIETLKQYIDRYSKEHKIDFNLHIFLDGDEIVSEYEAKYDIIFLDIEMKRLDGMSAAKKIRKFDEDVIIIFITNMAKYAINGYSVGAFNFLLKPLPYFAFSQELSKSIERLKGKVHKSILVPTKDAIIRVNCKEITYIESSGHNLVINTKDHQFNMRGTLKKMEEDLTDFHFFRCNNGYLVNLAYVSGAKHDDVIVGNARLKISRPRKKKFMEALTNYIGGKL